MIKIKEKFRCFKYLARTLPFAIVLRAIKKELIFSKLRMEVLETFFKRLDPRSSIVSRMNFPWGLQHQKKHFNVIFSSCSLIDLISG